MVCKKHLSTEIKLIFIFDFFQILLMFGWDYRNAIITQFVISLTPYICMSLNVVDLITTRRLTQGVGL